MGMLSQGNMVVIQVFIHCSQLKIKQPQMHHFLPKNLTQDRLTEQRLAIESTYTTNLS